MSQTIRYMLLIKAPGWTDHAVLQLTLDKLGLIAQTPVEVKNMLHGSRVELDVPKTSLKALYDWFGETTTVKAMSAPGFPPGCLLFFREVPTTDKE